MSDIVATPKQLREQITLKTFLKIWNQVQNRKTPKLHEEFCDFIQDTLDDELKILQAYRHSGKSALIPVLTAWYLYCDPSESIIIISGGKSLATRNAGAVRDVLMRHPLTNGAKKYRHNKLFVHFTRNLVPDNLNKDWAKNEFNIRGKGNTGDLLNASVYATSIGSSITGRHSTRVIGDDIETSDNAKSDLGRAEIIERMEELTNSISNNVLLIGTPHDAESLYKKYEDEGFAIVKKWH